MNYKLLKDLKSTVLKSFVIIFILITGIQAQNVKSNNIIHIRNTDDYQFPKLPMIPQKMSPGLYNVIIHNFYLTLRDNVVLDCSEYYPDTTNSLLPNGYPAIIMCHGYGLRKETLDIFARNQAALGYCVYTYSMRGQGLSGGLSNLISITEALDLIEFVNYVKHDFPVSGLDSNNILIMGGSQGGIIPYMAACNGMNVKTIIAALASPEFASSWIENGSVKMTLLWSVSYPNDTVKYNPLVASMFNWIISDTPEKWDSLSHWLPIDRNFTNQISQNTLPILIENSWQDKFFNASGNINSIPLVTSPKRYYLGAVVGHGGDSSTTENIWHRNFFNEWFYYWLLGVNNNILTRPKYHFAYTSYPQVNRMWSFVHDSSSVWPLNNLSDLKLYFYPGNKLKTVANTADTNFFVNLNNTVSGGLTMSQAIDWQFTGNQFNSQFQKADLVFETDAFLQNTKIIGTPVLNIDYSSNTTICQFNFQIFEVAGANAKLVSRINFTDRSYITNTRKTKLINGQSFAHIFQSGNKMRIIITNLDRTPDDTNFLKTNPTVLPVLKNGVDKFFLNPNSYIILKSHTPSIGIFNQQTNIPAKYTLNQNYPNPFNPVTVIEYQIPKSGNVKLTIYDALGKKVSTPVNESQNAGYYKIEWNAAALPSGVYFYTLETGSFVSNKKMILIK